MRCLIRHITRHSKGGVIFQDKSVDTRALSIGRAAGEHVFVADMRVALQHAVFTELAAGRFLVQSRALSGIRVNQRLLQSATVTVGDSVRVGYTTLRLFEPPEDYDLALEVEAGSEQAAEPVAPGEAVIAESLSGPVRRLSWALFIGILLVFLALPAGGRYLGDYYYPVLDTVAEYLSDEDADEYFEFPPMPLLLSDGFWNSGEIASAHHFFRRACGTCHHNPFERVPDQACINCHRKTHPHVDPEFYDLPKLENTRCAECHHEHNGARALIERDDRLCSECHQDLSRQGVDTTLEDARDFGSAHPVFKPTLIGHDDGMDTSRRVSMNDEADFYETSNLEFPHDVHLDRGGLSTIDGIFHLWCEDCHIHEAGSPDMVIADYQTMCHDCHPLIFDPVDESREVPHGKLKEVMFTLHEYYAKRALEGGYDDGGTPDVVRLERFPDEALTENERLLALDWAREKAEEVGEEVFEFSLCIECHRVDQVSRDPARWDIVPVRITRHWLAKARFTHEKHKTMACLFCHAAPESSVSGDVLIPPLAVCRECHGGIHETDRLQSSCVDCHGFHVAEDFVMKGN